jgi:light-regulated signal transduction histidine kinase (bacteriophytochrome)
VIDKPVPGVEGAGAAAAGPDPAAVLAAPADAASIALQLAQKEAELQALRAELEEFFRVASHDLRAPLRHITAFGGLLRERIDELGGDAEAREFLGAVQRSGEQLTRMVDGLLELSRIGRVPLQIEVVDLAALAREVQAELSGRALGRAALITVEWQMPEATVFCRADPSLLRQLLRHLLDNALKFTGRSPSPHIKLSAVREPGGILAVQLADNGAGFRMEGAGRLFGVFERLHPTSEFEGAGIGLSASRRIVDRLGGQITITGDVGKGCTVSFTLPEASGIAT